MIRAVIFDIGMVLLRFDFNLTIQKLKGQCAVTPEEMSGIFFKSGLVDALDRGQIETKEFAQKVSQLIGFQGLEEDLIEAWSDIFEHNLPMIERAKRWKVQGLPLYLLSNTCEAHIDFFTSKYDFFGMFDGGVYSCREKCAKPEKNIYLALLHRYGLEARTTLMIDDRIENVLAARELQIHAIQYQDEKSLLKELEVFGLA